MMTKWEEIVEIANVAEGEKGGEKINPDAQMNHRQMKENEVTGYIP